MRKVKKTLLANKYFSSNSTVLPMLYTSNDKEDKNFPLSTFMLIPISTVFLFLLLKCSDRLLAKN